MKTSEAYITYLSPWNLNKKKVEVFFTGPEIQEKA